ncbi:MAG: restriction endonuclease [Geminicoccaceae bacterium]|nr:restriction endonuclease [Geminicoccaceae bacterium]
MRRGHLADYFKGVGVKRLSAVETEPARSNQHEVNTTPKMRASFLGENHKQKFPAIFVWLGEDQDGFTAQGSATHYDTRRNQPRSAEWRLYYPTNPVTEAMTEGDTLFLARDNDGTLWFIVAPERSTSEHQLFWLFGLRPEGRSFVFRNIKTEEPELDFAARFILDEIGIEFEDPEGDKLDGIIDRFGSTFPPTAKFSQLARETLPEVRAEDDPDVALVAWLDHEEALFRRLERRIVAERLEQGFVTPDGIDVDGFISFSLGVHNRRKSRMGYSLENHVSTVFDAFGLTYARGATTEHNHRPDFLFPDEDSYHAAPPEGDRRLMMLGVKSTCKDRWRQVLAEAAKISRKHLLTLEPGISVPQTEQMNASGLQLVIPSPIQATYTANQQAQLWDFSRFIATARACQS